MSNFEPPIALDPEESYYREQRRRSGKEPTLFSASQAGRTPARPRSPSTPTST